MAASKAKRSSSGLSENVKTIVYAGLIAVFIRTFLFEPFNIPSGSMIPTLLVGDYLFVEKYSYGYSRYSFPFSPDLFNGRIFGSVPHRGDVMVFRYPPDPSIDYIKRVIGLPGDKVQVQNGQLFVNGKEVPRRADGTYVDDESGISMVLRQYKESLPPSGTGKPVVHAILKATDAGDANNTGVYTVPPGELFVMGDNRDNSADSRFWGFVPMQNLVGKAELIFFSIDARYPWWEVWEWPFEIRWNRIGMVIH
ncbi:MAG: signal peptidase I [Rhodospirillales bacterium]|jgi:signal peptidase I|nr:signal peptidase I [Rhodospirillales bacterium]